MYGLYLVPSPSRVVSKGFHTCSVETRIHLIDVPKDYGVYLFVFSGYEQLTEIEEPLSKFGAKAGKNLFVGFWGMDDTNYKILAEAFNLEDLPAIVITAKNEFAGLERQKGIVYARMDNKKLMKQVDLVMDATEKLFNLFLRGQFREAIGEAEKVHKIALIRDFVGKLKEAWGSVKEFLDKHKITIGVAEFTFTLEPIPTSR